MGLADEIRVKGCQMIPWMALALMVSTRLWLGGVVSLSRDRHLAGHLLRMVKACCQPLRPVLVLTDGWSAYSNSIRRAFRKKVKQTVGRGRSKLQAWLQVVIGTVIKRTEKKRVVEVIRRLTQGPRELAATLLQASRGGTDLNTAFIERLNAPMRERLSSLTHSCRHAARRLKILEADMWLVGCTANFCWPHHELSRKGAVLITPAMASGLTDHLWSVRELLGYRIAPPLWVAPKRRGRSGKFVTTLSKRSSARPRPLLRLRKGTLCPSTR